MRPAWPGTVLTAGKSSECMRWSRLPAIHWGVAVPDYQSLMAPALHALADGQEHPMPELRTVIVDQVALTLGDLAATRRSG